METLSFILATRDRREYLPRAIASVLGQTRGNWELVVLDNGESVADIVPPDRRVVYQHSEAGGPADAFDQALRLATGSIVMPISDDDWLAPQTVEVVLAGIGDHEWGYAQTAYQRRGSTIDILGGPWDLGRLKGGYYLGGAVFWRKRLSDRLGGFDPQYDGAADYDLYLRFGTDSEPVYIQQVLYYYQEWPGTDSQRRRGNQITKASLIGARARGEV